jgi:hypothetical protein
MRINYARRLQFQGSQTLLGRLMGLVVLFLVVVAAVFVFLIGAVVAGLTMLLAPVVGWWRSRQGVRPPPSPPESIEDEPVPRVIDAEFTPIERDGK